MITVPLKFTDPAMIGLIEAGLRRISEKRGGGPERVKRQAILRHGSKSARAVMTALEQDPGGVRLSLWAAPGADGVRASPIGTAMLRDVARVWFLRHDGARPVCLVRRRRPGPVRAFEPMQLGSFEACARFEGHADAAEAEARFFKRPEGGRPRDDVWSGLMVMW